MMREKVTLAMTMKDVCIMLSEGNPGALNVIMQIMDSGRSDLLLIMDDMNIRGPQVWLGYKDYCGEDLDYFMACLLMRDREMVDTINKNAIYDNEFGKFDEVARVNRFA